MPNGTPVDARAESVDTRGRPIYGPLREAYRRHRAVLNAHPRPDEGEVAEVDYLRAILASDAAKRWFTEAQRLAEARGYPEPAEFLRLCPNCGERERLTEHGRVEILHGPRCGYDSAAPAVAPQRQAPQLAAVVLASRRDDDDLWGSR